MDICLKIVGPLCILTGTNQVWEEHRSVGFNNSSVQVGVKWAEVMQKCNLHPSGILWGCKMDVALIHLEVPGD